ncbi:MAG: galactitol-1-phosphate 5-dehydrogenase [Fimbriimonas sp.]|nr:galactitol-1-phosphate 5-dehydrogenase [Fimbriimonas sp.]
MKALQLVEYGRFERVEMPVPEIAEDEVLIRVKACGICGSDVHGLDGSTGRRLPPIVMGHEAAGEIVKLGSGVSAWNVGDRVTFESVIFCNKCDYCKRGQTNLCDNRQVFGVSCTEFRKEGAFAEYLPVHARSLFKLPDGLTYEQAAMAEPVSVAVHAVDRACIKPGDRVAVVGVGMIGLLVVQVLKARGAGEVIAVDINQAKLAMAAAHGADMVTQSTIGMELDCAIEAVGITPTVDMAIRSVKKAGTVVLIGNLSSHVDFPLQEVVTRQITVNGTYGSEGDYPECLDLIASGAVNVDGMISAKISLDETAEYFDRLYKQEPGLMKVIVRP